MLAKIKTVSFLGIEVLEITVEVHIGNGLPFFTIVGLPDKNISEAKDRIRAAFNVLGVSLPAKRITVNMSPANIQKEGSHYDLPIAIGILVAMGTISQDLVNNWLIIGELSLDGGINNTKGSLLASIFANSKNYTLICSTKSSYEVQLTGNKNVLIFQNLTEIIGYQNGGGSYLLDDYELRKQEEKFEIDMSDIEGQTIAKRILEIAAVFRLNVLMIGQPGIGKSMLAKRLITILPPLTPSEILEINMIYSIAENTSKQDFFAVPYRDPHYSTTLAALIGGGTKAQPGEVTLAHKGVLFLDELGEYTKVLEGLRQCMEDKKVTIARANKHIQYPADCQIIAAMNPCKCGYLNTEKQCKKAPQCSENYKNNISGPLLDRFDLIFYLENENHLKEEKRETSEEIRNRVIKARELYYELYQKQFEEILFEEIKAEKEAINLINQYCDKKKLSKRVRNKTFKTALVISLLENSKEIKTKHMLEATMYRANF
ncbi:YifB family Mg chelatase-like AAA ATPase [Alphaproteobacteria bacterium endosymbiont of Tiliacea citrago]|uniref:YifB family Mg chelatase-like AAA ATPase n=1 Tax=Alphaproteobacteria bacterium endosymbiont of Tiliacea citrago TaxID=3077944 RepID=UPI00313BBFFB